MTWEYKDDRHALVDLAFDPSKGASKSGHGFVVRWAGRFLLITGGAVPGAGAIRKVTATTVDREVTVTSTARVPVPAGPDLAVFELAAAEAGKLEVLDLAGRNAVAGDLVQLLAGEGHSSLWRSKAARSTAGVLEFSSHEEEIPLGDVGTPVLDADEKVVGLLVARRGDVGVATSVESIRAALERAA